VPTCVLPSFQRVTGKSTMAGPIAGETGFGIHSCLGLGTKAASVGPPFPGVLSARIDNGNLAVKFFGRMRFTVTTARAGCETQSHAGFQAI